MFLRCLESGIQDGQGNFKVSNEYRSIRRIPDGCHDVVNGRVIPGLVGIGCGQNGFRAVLRNRHDGNASRDVAGDADGPEVEFRRLQRTDCDLREMIVADAPDKPGRNTEAMGEIRNVGGFAAGALGEAAGPNGAADAKGALNVELQIGIDAAQREHDRARQRNLLNHFVWK
uniref:hypothetical protein n=1 Tax=Mesorhizobium sp. L-2-11 TaxID=2744521 RepID=UPI001925DC47|nr:MULTISPECIES: hypothetical protein [unclassified Mesorhizobium]